VTARTEAIAALQGAIDPAVLGQSVIVEGVAISAVKRTLSQEEAAFFGAPNLAVEGMRLTFDPAALGFELAFGTACTVDGVEYEVRQVDKPAGNRRVTFIRYLS
jgi:arginine/lysine/ornithine decarboxylase